MKCNELDCQTPDSPAYYYESRNGKTYGWICVPCLRRLGPRGQRLVRLLIHKTERDLVRKELKQP